MSKTISVRPRLSEKTYGLSESRVYVVDVPRDVNKHTVARAVEAQFEVKVAKVNIANIAGKSKRVISASGKRVKNAEGRRSDIKKAYVTLSEGHSLPFFAAIEEEEQKEEAIQEKVDKAAAKQAAKATKKAPKKAPVADETPQPEEQPKPRRGWRLPRKRTKAEKEGGK
ncbi:MAG TPA: 50S ribosomal protein L23 [Candidatus Saccharimonadales bacterium]|nr:50S ribosomal protein L23 [Candidatus Saccharimonadales bacterium]